MNPIGPYRFVAFHRNAQELRQCEYCRAWVASYGVHGVEPNGDRSRTGLYACEACIRAFEARYETDFGWPSAELFSAFLRDASELRRCDHCGSETKTYAVHGGRGGIACQPCIRHFERRYRTTFWSEEAR